MVTSDDKQPQERIRVVRLLPELDYGGAESRVALQAEWIDRTCFDFRVCTFHKPGAAAERIRQAGIPVDVLGCSPAIRNPVTTFRLFRYLRKVRPAVLHSSIGEANYHGALAGWLARVPNRIVEEVGLSEAHLITRRMLRFAYHRADTVIGVSQTVCDHVCQWLRLDPTRVERIYNPIPPAFLEPIVRVPRNPDEPFRLLAVGRLVPEKNHLFLFDVLEQLNKEGLPVRLRIAGEGPMRPILEAEISRRSLSDQVDLLGYRSDIPKLLAATDIFLFPSTREGQPNAILEAIAIGIPVLASDIPSNCELPCATARLDPQRWADGVIATSSHGLGDPCNGRAQHLQSVASYLIELQAHYCK